MAEEDVRGHESLRLTRSATIFHALVRIFGLGKLPSRLVLHVVGADHREGSTPDQTRSLFADLFDWLGRDERVRDLDMLFCGPNIAAGLHDARHSFTHRIYTRADSGRNGVAHHENNNGGSAIGSAGNERFSLGTARCHDLSMAVTLQFNAGLYHDVSGLFAPADALFLFNAGLWGYDDWLPTLEHVLGRGVSSTADGMQSSQSERSRDESASRTTRNTLAGVVVTSYCTEEAEDDMETLERLLLCEDEQVSRLGTPGTANVEHELEEKLRGSGIAGASERAEWLWKPEVNPHRSLVPRPTACGVEGRKLFENHSWQAIRPPQRRSHAMD